MRHMSGNNIKNGEESTRTPQSIEISTVISCADPENFLRRMRAGVQLQIRMGPTNPDPGQSRV